MEELAPFVVGRCIRRRFRGYRGVDELEHERPARNDALASRKEVSSNNTIVVIGRKGEMKCQ